MKRRPLKTVHAPETRSAFNWDSLEVLGLGAVLALFAIVAVGPGLGLEFVGDDYVFLDKTRAASFAQLWSPATSVDFGWYRPWARELHYWLLQKGFGLNALPYRCFNMVLWVVALCFYATVIGRLTSRKVAAIAALGVSVLAFWGTPLVWVSGSQDLWMLVFSMFSLLLFMARHSPLALAPFLLALLSKETAGILPALLCAYLLIVERNTVGQVLRRTWSFWAILITWALLHPTLRARLSGGLPPTPELEHRLALPMVLIKSAAACVNLDKLPRPQEIDAGAMGRVLVTALLLATGILFAVRKHKTGIPASDTSRLRCLAGAWALIGWCPLLLPSIGWHAYYGCVGALGVWFGLALWLESRPVVAVGVITAVALLRGAQANTLSSDWGDETYFRRAGSTLAAIRDDLRRQHPSLPPHSRLYFAEIPAHIGLVAGNSPALRVWYADSTLQAGFYSYYRPRRESEPSGADYFFRFDSAVGMIEVRAGDEDVPNGLQRNSSWESDHDGLAALFTAKGDLPSAALELEKLSRLPHRAGAAIRAAVYWRVEGDTLRADRLLRAAMARLQLSDSQMRGLIDRVEISMKRAGVEH